ncbi:hypothetical protein IAI10_22390 [Clostridium sp. 19966]|uniref:hypothetical protein n=1 Tax=Clostridium sp. 19966 TaxID=2768166 RepID=UPI0028E05A92|nr:hypothetical protein [Clostridium sp. 19966]MDT8719406.1 hypothetical protein [Clostridium sp. 19966]
MPTEIDLLKIGRISSTISIIISLIFIYSTNESLQIEYARAKDETPPVFKPTPAQISTVAFFMAIFTNMINYKISVARYEQIREKQEQGDTTINISPNIKFILATGLALTGAALAYIAAKEKLESDVQIIIAR